MNYKILGNCKINDNPPEDSSGEKKKDPTTTTDRLYLTDRPAKTTLRAATLRK